MFYFAADKPLYRHTGFAVIALLMLSFIFGMPPFQTGIWYQAEPSLFVLFALSALGALWIAAGLAKGWLAPAKPHLLFYAVLAWGAWQVFVTLASPTAWRSWFGPPQIGMGTASYLLMAVSFCLIYPFWQLPVYRTRLLWLAALNVALIAAMQLLFAETPWEPERWADYLAFILGYLWVALLLGEKLPNAKFFLLILAMFLGLYASENLSAMMFMTLAMLLATILSGLSLPPALQRFFLPSRKWRGLMMLACLAPVAFVILSGYIPARFHDSGEIIESELQDADSSMGSRVRLNQLSLTALRDEPKHLLYPKGWGSYADDSFKYTMLEGVTRFEGELQKPNWGLVNGVAFHNHNQPVEALLSFGVIGLLLWYAVFFIALWTIPAGRFWLCAPMVVAICCAAGFWFELPRNMPYQALFFVALCGAVQPQAVSKNMRLLLPVAAALLCAVMAWTACAQYRAVRYSTQLFKAVIFENTLPENLTINIEDDLKRDGWRLLYTIENFVHKSMDRNADGSADATDIAWYRTLLSISQEMASHDNIGVRGQVTELFLLNNLFINLHSPLYAPLKPEAKPRLLAAVLQLTRVAPKREDLAAAFLSNLDAFTDGNQAGQADILKQILEIYPHHRSALWLLGKQFAAAKNDPQMVEAGLAMQKEAVQNGLASVFPINGKELESFRK